MEPMQQDAALQFCGKVLLQAVCGVQAAAAPAAPAAAIKKGLLDNYDDAEGYYNFQVGEVLNDRYEVRRAVCKAVLEGVQLTEQGRLGTACVSEGGGETRQTIHS